MKSIAKLLIVILVSSILVGCSSKPVDRSGQVQIPSTLKDIKGKHFEEIVASLEESGFTNIRLEKIEDLITGWLTKDGEVEKVSIDGLHDYEVGKYSPIDSEIVVFYHTFALKEESENKDESASVPKEESPKEPEKDKIDSELPEILTADNNDDVKRLLVDLDTSHEFLIQFAEKYRGKTFQFDGHIADVAPYKDYNTVFNFLIYLGDYHPDTASGVSMQAINKNMNRMNFTGDNIPEYITADLNITMTARIDSFNQLGGLLIIDPVETRFR